EREQLRVQRADLIVQLGDEGREEPFGKLIPTHVAASCLPPLPRLSPPTSVMSCLPMRFSSRAADSASRVGARFCCAACCMLATACLICVMPVACCPADAEICAAACDAPAAASASMRMVWSAALICCTPCSTVWLPCSATTTA